MSVVDADVDTLTVSNVERQACVELLYLEARLLDKHALQDWLELYAQDAVYWVPLLEHYRDPDAELNIIYDDRARLVNRVGRLESGIAYAQDPPSRTARIVGNVAVEKTGRGYETDAAFILYETRMGETQIFAGRYFHTIRSEDGVLRITRKVVELLNRDEPFYNLTFIL